MKHPVFWFSVLSVVVMFIAYLALTAGTRFLLDDGISKIEPGMNVDEARKCIPPEWFTKSPVRRDVLTKPIGPRPPHVEPDYWHFDNRQFSWHLKGPIALRYWEIVVNFSPYDGKVERVQYHATDWHERAYDQIRYWIEKKWQSLR